MAGTSVLVAHDHSETFSGTLDIYFTGYNTSGRLIILCVNTSTGQLADTASITATTQIRFRGRIFIRGIRFTSPYFEGSLQITPATALYPAFIQLDNDAHFKNCKLTITGNGTGLEWTGRTDSTAAYRCLRLEDTPIAFNNSANGITITNGSFLWTNTENAIQNVGGGLPSTLFRTNATNSFGSSFELDGVDLSGLGANTLIGVNTCPRYFKMSNCKLAAATTLRSSNPIASSIEFHLSNCDSSATSYKYEMVRLGGTVSSDTLVKAMAPRRATSDGTTNYCHRIGTSTYLSFGLPFYTEDYVVPHNCVQSPVTVEMYLTSYTTPLTNKDVWMEIEYNGTDKNVSDFASTRGPLIGSATTLATDTYTTWNNALGGLTNYKLSLQIQPKYPEPLRIRIYVAKPNAVIYLHPRPRLIG